MGTTHVLRWDLASYSLPCALEYLHENRIVLEIRIAQVQMGTLQVFSAILRSRLSE
ncbi:hypothetical protein SBA4_1090007 [Candidatus Sulfopaludibacter sp. SbA4]|nr:hypothetical protein SBA4_1090007 [Candidatus Sulfopaludibacter sp. SbA4]